MKNPTPHFYPFERIILGYCALMLALIAVFGRPIGGYIPAVIAFMSCIAVTWLIAGYVDNRDGRVQAFVRLLYPIVIFMVLYRTTGSMMFLFFDRFHDSQLTAFESAVFGGDLSMYIDRHLLNVWLNELFSFCYFSYYLMLPSFLLWMYITRRDKLAVRSLAAVSLTFFASYLLFSLYPIEGPRYYFAASFAHRIEGPVFRPLVEFVIANGAVHGGCMPSSHVGVALVVLFYCFKVNRRIAWVLVPINVGLAIGTVWGRFHYISDVFVGAAIALIAVWIVERYHDRWLASVAKNKPEKELVVEHVS
jgi:membrane-associated phospholipid phosphatase